MITVLVVGAADADEEAPASLELLHAASADEAIEKLGRNRRIDAVLVVALDPAEVVRAIGEDVLAPPPIFVAGDAPDAASARRLEAPAGERRRLLDAIASELSGGD